MANPALPSSINPHFFQPLLPGFHHDLKVPVRFFMNHIEGKNENVTAKLRSDVSHKTWEVKMVGRRFTDGWEDFANDHDFRIGDIIVFRHLGDLVFHVTAFGPSCCNLQYSSSRGNMSMVMKAEKNSRTEAAMSSSSHSCFVARVTSSNLNVDKLVLPRKFARSNGLDDRFCEILLLNEQGRSWTLYLNHKKSSDDTYIRGGWRRFCRANGRKAGDFFTLKLARNGTTPWLQLCTTECGGDGALQVRSGAKEAKKTNDDSSSEKLSIKERRRSGECSKREEAKRSGYGWRISSVVELNRFMTFKISQRILRDGYARLPIKFTRANGILNPGEITLVDKYGVGWPTSLWKAKARGTMGLGKGLSGFLRANGAKDGESFVMRLSWRDTRPILKFCSKNHLGTKSEVCETAAAEEAAGDKVAKAQQKICDTSTHHEVINVKEEEQCLVALPPREFNALENGGKVAPKKHSRTAEEMKKMSSRKHCSKDEKSSEGECLKRKTRKPHWRASSSPRQNRFATLTLTPSYSKNHILCLPLRFTKVNGIKKPREIILMDRDGRERGANLMLQNKRGAMRVGRESEGFCEANGVETGESFVVELIWKDTTPMLKFCYKIKNE